MDRRTSLRDLVGVLKDKASLSKAALLFKPTTSSLHLAILHATTHQSTSPPHEKHIAVLLSFGDSSRNIAATCIEALMDRLHRTRNSVVAFKCLITVHIIIRRGSFILQDQLSVHPTTGGRNYLNFSNFRDNCTPERWNLSSWVRWYARVLETLLLTFRVLGFFFCYPSKADDNESVTALLNEDLVKEIDVLVSLIEEICAAPDLFSNKMAYEVMSLVGQDCNSAQKELFVRINEIKLRIDALSFAESVELVCALKRLENCRERVILLFLNRKGSIGENLWGLVTEMREKIGERKDYCDRRLLVKERRSIVSESARFGDRVVGSGELFRFASGRLNLDRLALPSLEFVEQV